MLLVIKTLTYNIVGSRIEFELTSQLLESGEITPILFFIDRQKQISPKVQAGAFSSGFDLGFF